MTFSDLVKIMYKYLGTGQSPAVFVSEFIYILMGANEDIPDGTDCEFYPYHMRRESHTDPNYNICNKIFNGHRSISHKNASKIHYYFVQDKEAFFWKIQELEDEQKDELQRDLETYGIVFEEANYMETLADVVEKILSSYMTTGEGFDFSRTPSRTIAGDKLHGVPITSVVIKDGKLFVGGIQRKLSDKLEIPTEIDNNTEGRYVNAILEAYADEMSSERIPIDKIDTLKPFLLKHLTAQRKNFYDAEYLRRLAREILEDGDSQFEILEKDIEAGIETVLYTNTGNGFDRLKEVLKRSTEIQLTSSDLCFIRNAIGIRTRQGMCHELVNDGIIESWVNKDE